MIAQYHETVALPLAAEALDLPYVWGFSDSSGLGSIAPTAIRVANRKGAINLMVELGGAGCVTPDVLRRTERRLRRVMHAPGMLPGCAPDASRGTRALSTRESVYADDTGGFEPLKSLVDNVAERETVALIHRSEPPGQEPEAVASPHGRVVLAMRAITQVRAGRGALSDCVGCGLT